MLQPNFVHNAVYIASWKGALTYWRHFCGSESDWDTSDSGSPLGKVNWPSDLALVPDGILGVVDKS